MPTVSASTIVDATAQAAFDFIADYRNIPFMQPQFTTATLASGVERGQGAVVELKGRFHGIPMKVHNRIIAFVPPRRLVSISDGTILSRSTWEFDELDTNPPSTRVTLTLDYSLRKVLGGLFMGVGSALWPLFDREVQGMTDESLKRLREYFESDAHRTDPQTGIGQEQQA
jgi:ribosome-associated toxin RatA of RatAB toxin-antitoxin module